MDALGPRSPARRVVFMKGSQLGGTEAGNNWLGFVMHHSPGPILVVRPTVEEARRFSRQRLDPMIATTPVLRDLVKEARSRDGGNSLLIKEFPGGVLFLTGSNSATGVKSMPIRWLFCDEIDEYPGDVDGQGDPIALAEKRTTGPDLLAPEGLPRLDARRSRASRGSSGSSWPRTSAATSSPARTAGTSTGSGGRTSAGRRATRRAPRWPAWPAGS